ncbi:MAG TPA: DUF2240 family protein [Methanosarcinales archaeon]|nr:DUF2240 family protein [Methanosarcinales archaeon]
MMDKLNTELKYTIAQPFKIKGADSLTINEFIFVLSLDLRWFTPNQSKQFLQIAIKNGLVSVQDNIVKPKFNTKSIEIPIGFKPDLDITQLNKLYTSIKEQTDRGVFEKTISRIISNTGRSKKEIMELVNKTHEKLLKIVDIEVAALLVASELDININDLIDEAYEKLVNSV